MTKDDSESIFLLVIRTLLESSIGVMQGPPRSRGLVRALASSFSCCRFPRLCSLRAALQAAATAAGQVEAEQRKQQTDQLRDYFALLTRLDNVAFRLRVANRDDCKNWTWAQIGLNAGTVPSLPRKYRSFSHEALSVSWTRATVLSVAERSPAAAGGIKIGDQLLTVNNEPVPPHRNGRLDRRFRSQ